MTVTSPARPTLDDIDDRIDAWHDQKHNIPSLHEAMGWTAQEWDNWIMDSSDIPDRPLPSFQSVTAKFEADAKGTDQAVSALYQVR